MLWLNPGYPFPHRNVRLAKRLSLLLNSGSSHMVVHLDDFVELAGLDARAK